MRIKSLHIQRFRSIQDLTLDFDTGLTTLVGENGVGKSTIGIALNKLIRTFSEGGDQITSEDYPYGEPAEVAIEATFNLVQDEIENLFLQGRLVPPKLPDANTRLLSEWFKNQGDSVTLSYQQGTKPWVPIRWGELEFRDSDMRIGGARAAEHNVGLWADYARTVAQPSHHLEGSKLLVDSGVPVVAGSLLSINMPQVLAQSVASKFKPVAEFRVPTTPGQRSAVLESMSGAETASVLLNLKNHRNRGEQRRYSQVVETFHTFFPRFQIEAVERNPGGGQPEIQFYENGRQNPLTLNQVSAGVHEILTIVTNIVGREGLIVFLEHPETNLHPHSMRALGSLLVNYVNRNQVIVVTHNPNFVNPRAPWGLRRFWWTPEKGTQVAVPKLSNEREVGQVQTALRHVGDREVVFARAVLLVEDESQKEFVTSVASTLGFDLDANSISVIAVGSHDGFPPYRVLVEKLGIPFAALRDKAWGDDCRYPPGRFFHLGPELEQYLDGHGLSGVRQEVIKEVGDSKRRQAAALGPKLTKAQIPELFSEVLRVVTDLAGGNPIRSKSK